MKKAVDFVHAIIRETLEEGDTAIDATVGNGRDTALLAQAVGASGKVYGFDIQKRAIESARSELARFALEKRVELFHQGHEHMDASLPAAIHGRVSAVMFNLGYLPRGDKSIVTQPASTLRALYCAFKLLAPDGVITIVLYTGHTGGEAEAQAVCRWASELDQEKANALEYRFINQKNNPPSAIVVRKK